MAVSLPDQRKSLTLGPYRLIAQLARGGMGIVYLAVMHGPGGFSKLLVVKELKPSFAEEEEYVAMFLREARLAARLNHPNVVQTLDVRSEGDRHLIAMEFLDGQSLDRIQRRVKKAGAELPLEFHLHVLVQLLEALHYVHGVNELDGRPMNLVHRDVSPQNVLIGYDGQVKILDFGIAKAEGGDAQTTSVGILKGKARWMAPEQAKFNPLDRRSDLFAVGALLWEAILGEPFWPKTMVENDILLALARGSVPRPRDVSPELDPAAERLLLRATAADPDQRFAGADEMQAAVQDYLESLGKPAVTPRKLGKLVADQFAQERVQVNGVVEKILRDVAEGKAVEPVKLAFGRRDAQTDPELSMSSISSISIGSLGTQHDDSSGRSRQPVSTSTNPSEQEQPRGSSPAVYIVAGLLAVAVVVSALFATRRGVTHERPTTTAEARAAATDAAPAPVPSIHVTIHARPADAVITVDDGPPQVGAHASSLKSDGATHTIKVDAARHKPQTMSFTADVDHTFDLALEATPAPSPSPATAPAWNGRGATPRPTVAAVATAQAPTTVVAPAASPSAPPNLPATGNKRVRQPIEKNDPYATPP